MPPALWSFVEMLADDVARRYRAAASEEERFDIVFSGDPAIERAVDDYELSDAGQGALDMAYHGALRERLTAPAA